MIKDISLEKVSYNPFKSGKVEKAIPSTLSQQEMWSTLVLSPDANICYNEVISMEIKGAVSESRLHSAFQEILKRHEALRSTFSNDGKFFIVHEYSCQELSKLTLSEEGFEKFKQKETQIPFDLVNGPLVRASFIKISGDKSYFVFSAHHIVCDGWSLAIILTEFTRAYEGKTLLEPSSFVDFALKESFSGVNPRDKEFWLNQFKNPFSGNNLPTDFPRPRFRTYESQRIDIEVAPRLVSSWKKFSAKNRISFYTLLMGSFKVLLSKISGQEDIVVGMATAAQSIPGNEEVVGHLVNMLPLRTNVDPKLNAVSYLQSLKSVMMEAIDHQSYTFGSLLRDLKVTRDPSQIPLVNVVFNIDQQLPYQGLEFESLSAHYQSVPRVKENFEIFINAVSREDSLTLECQFNSNLFTAETIRNWLDVFISIVSEVASKDLMISEIQTNFSPKSEVVKTPEVEKKSSLVINPKNEERLIPLWESILSCEVAPTDNFFTLGGHSLLVVELINQIEKEFNRKLTARQVFENPTVRELSQVLFTESSEKIDEITAVGAKESYVVTPGQLQSWYLEEAYGNSHFHHLPSSIRLKFKVDIKALEKAINSLVQRQEALRTIVETEAGLPRQIILDKVNEIKLSVEEVLESKLNERLQALFLETISIKQFPLFKVALLKISDEDYVFFFMPHHVIWDGWSFDIFFEELNLAYSAFARERNPAYSAINITYKDYAHWLNQQINAGKLEKEREYWIDKLKAPLPLMNLVQGSRPAVINQTGLTYSFEFDQDLVSKLHLFAQENAVSLYNVFLTAFKITISKYASEEDVIVGTPVRCRNFPELLNVIGYFVNTLALRTRINTRENFLSNLRRVSQGSIESFDHGQLPFQEVLKSVKIPRDSSRTPIYQTFFSYQDVSGRKPELDGHAYQQINVNKNTTHTDIDLWLKAGKNRIEGAFEYREDLFSKEWINEFFQGFLSELETAVSNNDFSGPKASKKDLNNTELKSLVCMFEETTREHGNKLVIKSEDARLSYQELNERANQFAYALLESGVKAGDLVGISITRKIELLISLLGVLKVGAGYVPLDPSFPQDRLDYMIENSNIRVLITEKSIEGRFSSHLTKLTLDALLEANYSKNNLEREIPLDSTAYVIYTSGSTGKPKGVEVSNLGLANFLVSMRKKPGIHQNDRLLAVTTLSFDIAVLELFLPIISGASIYLASSYDVIDGQALKSIIEKNSITYMQATPSTWRLLLAAGWKGDTSFKILCGGEAFPKDLATKLIPLVDSVWNMYGPTETTVWSTCKKLSLDEPITVGSPIDRTTIYILDEKRNILPDGSEGELFIGGAGLAKGYFNRKDLTDERFINHPENHVEIIYATGDLAKVNQFGELEVLGRLDGQVKVRGYRIELGEIEAQLNSFDDIDLSAVITKEVRPGDARIIAYYVTKGGVSVDEQSLRQRLGASLPKYMIPSHMVKIETIPQTLNGKIDKKTLGEMFVVDKIEESSVEATPIKHGAEIESIRDIWKQVLSVESIQDNDHFFDIGGNSLLAVELSSLIAKKTGKPFQLSMLLQKPEFLDFAQSFTGSLVSETALDNTKYLVPIKKTGERNPLFCVHTVGGNVLNYIQLTPALGDDRPMYGLQSTGLTDSYHPGNIEEMATLYIQEMKLLQPEGPYCIAGGSMGGMIALEIAQQLTKAGDKIEKLIMFDTFGPDFDIKKYKDDQRSRIGNFLAMLDYYYRMAKLIIKRKILGVLGAPETLEMRLFDLEIKNYYTLWKYRPQSYAGDLHLIRNEMQEKGWYSDPYLGWRKLIKGEIHTCCISASHSEFIESKELIGALKKLL